MPDGRPDLSGVWGFSNSSRVPGKVGVTRLEDAVPKFAVAAWHWLTSLRVRLPDWPAR